MQNDSRKRGSGAVLTGERTCVMTIFRSHCYSLRNHTCCPAFEGCNLQSTPPNYSKHSTGEFSSKMLPAPKHTNCLGGGSVPHVSGELQRAPEGIEQVATKTWYAVHRYYSAIRKKCFAVRGRNIRQGDSWDLHCSFCGLRCRPPDFHSRSVADG